MGSPVPDAIKHKLRRNDDGSPPTTEEVGELYKDSYRKFIENFTVQNDKVRYYCNKTMAMRQPLHAIIDDLILAQQTAMAYLDQVPRESDHYLLATIFTMIQKATNAINWKAMNHKCYWKDFCRETRQLRILMGQAEVVNLECCHTVVDKAKRATEILDDFRQETKIPENKFNKKGDETFPDEWDAYKMKMENSPLGYSGIQQSGPPLENEIIIVCKESSEAVHLEWIDQESWTSQMAKLRDTSESFRIRFLRSLIYCAHKSLQLLVLTMSRIEVSLRTEFPLEGLIHCDGLNPSELLPHERIVLAKSKKEFDCLWNTIMGAVCRFRLQLIELRKHEKVLKRLVKNPKYSKSIMPKAKQLNLRICEPLLLKFASKSEPHELTGIQQNRNKMYLDRTSDVITMIQDMWWTVDNSSFKAMDVLIMLLYSALNQVFEVLSKEEKHGVKNSLDMIFQQRDKVKRYLKKSVQLFHHSAFQDLPTIQHAKRFKSFIKILVSSVDMPLENRSESRIEEDDEDGGGSSTPVHLPGGLNVTIGEQKEFFVANLFKDRAQFLNLTEEEQVIVTRKMLTSLNHFVTSEACLSKNILARSTETKSLMKRLEPKDRINEALIINLTNGLNHIKNMYRLMNAMSALMTFAKKA